MPFEDQRRELVPVIIATIVAAIGAFFLWFDLRSDSLNRGAGIITSSAVSRAGAIVVASEQAVYLVLPDAVPVNEEHNR